MADIKTHLRELSVAVGIFSLKQGKTLNKLTCKEFYDQCKISIKNDVSGAKNILKNENFSPVEWFLIAYPVNPLTPLRLKRPLCSPLSGIFTQKVRVMSDGLPDSYFAVLLECYSLVLRQFGRS